MVITLQLVGGFLLLLLGGETLLKGSVGVAKRLGVSPLMIGIVLVGFGTSVPELVTCLQASLSGSPDIATGNVIGSNIANILLIIGAAALMLPIASPMREFKRDSIALVLFTLFFTLVCLGGYVSRIMGVVMVLLLGLYIVVIYRLERKNNEDKEAQMHKDEADVIEPTPKTLSNGLLMTAGGIVITLLGANFLVTGASDLARIAGISETIIGLTIVAIGTSLPELATAIIAGLKGHSDVSVGNILGSNIFNMMGIFGITAAVTPMNLPDKIVTEDLWIMVATTVLLIIMLLTGEKITRIEGGVLFALYATYMGYQFI